MFVLKASTWMATIKQFVPTILHATRTACDVRKTDGAYLDPGKAVFEATPSEWWATPSWNIAPVASREIIEVQADTYLGKDDIMRFEDIYVRVVD